MHTTDGHMALVLATMGAGIGMAMAPATEAIMGSLPKAKAGVGSAMNDVVREVAGTLGVAVLGSVLASAYASGMDGAVAGLPSDGATAASDSIGALIAAAFLPARVRDESAHVGADLPAPAAA